MPQAGEVKVNEKRKQEIRVEEKKFAPEKQDLKLDFKKTEAATYSDYKKSAGEALDTAELGSTSFNFQ